MNEPDGWKGNLLIILLMLLVSDLLIGLAVLGVLNLCGVHV
jgi:hypothetical protein